MKPEFSKNAKNRTCRISKYFKAKKRYIPKQLMNQRKIHDSKFQMNDKVYLIFMPQDTARAVISGEFKAAGLYIQL